MSRFLKNTINQNVVKNIEKQISCSKNDYDKIEKINLFVLDIKDQKKGYENTKQIEFSEECFAKFLQGLEPTDDTPRKLFHKIVHANRINFFMREGRLKSHLIQHHVTKEQAAFLQTNETGRMRFCQLCELIMNFFKIGFKIQNFENKNELNPSNYLLPCKFFSENKDKERIGTTKIPQLRLLTLYPIFYKNLYSKEEQYTTTINKIFNIGHKYDEHTGTTAITISEKI